MKSQGILSRIVVSFGEIGVIFVIGFLVLFLLNIIYGPGWQTFGIPATHISVAGIGCFLVYEASSVKNSRYEVDTIETAILSVALLVAGFMNVEMSKYAYAACSFMGATGCIMSALPREYCYFETRGE